MSVDVLRAYIGGYTDHIFDLQLVAVHQGYWSGYYNRAKKPKGVETVLKKLFKARDKQAGKTPERTRMEDVDVESFLAKEQLRLSQMKTI